MKKRVLPILATFCILASLSAEARANCATPDPIGPPCFEYWHADAVFIGLVTKVDRMPRLFYPGVSELASATVVVVADKQPERQEYIFHWPLPE